MDKDIITITDDGNVSIPSDVKMTIPEIADLFGVFCQTAKREIRAIEKSGVASGDLSLPCTVVGKSIYPEYYGLDMVIVLTFRIKSEKAATLRRWVLDKISINNKMQVFLSSDSISLN